ncbi:MAG: MmgE/PrpD family protein, partial [Alphaproteobacteria bacterium]
MRRPQEATTDDYLTRLARFAAETPGADIPADVRQRACLILADCVGCMIGGAGAAEVRRMAARHDSNGPATAPGLPGGYAPEAAAYVGGTAGVWHDLDEGNLHTRTHAAIQIAPALLAASEAGGRTGAAAVDAFVMGYEAASRLWRAARIRLAVHPHGVTGPLAAAVALARLRGDDADRMRTVMNIAMTLGLAASRQALADGATVRNVYCGHSGRAAFEALALADVGIAGERDAPASILGGIYGDGFDPESAGEGLGALWLMRKSYFKRHPSGRYIHGALDALEELIARLGPARDPDRVARIDVRTYFMATTMGRQDPDSPFGLRFSLPAALAARLVLGPRPLVDDGAAAFGDARVRALARRIFVTEDAAATAAYPDLQPTALVVSFADGRAETASIDRMLGESDRPFPAGVLARKFHELAAPALGEAAAARAYDAILRLDACDDVAA